MRGSRLGSQRGIANPSFMSGLLPYYYKLFPSSKVSFVTHGNSSFPYYGTSQWNLPPYPLSSFFKILNWSQWRQWKIRYRILLWNFKMVTTTWTQLEHNLNLVRRVFPPNNQKVGQATSSPARRRGLSTMGKGFGVGWFLFHMPLATLEPFFQPCFHCSRYISIRSPITLWIL